MKNILFILILFFPFSSFSQQEQIVFTYIENGDPVENVLVYNLTHKTFNYTNAAGEAVMSYATGKDSFYFRIPGFETVYHTVEEIKSGDNKVLLKPYFEALDEVLITDTNMIANTLKREMKTNRKYYSKLVSSGASLVSTYHHQGCTGNLKALSFFIDKSALAETDSIFIRPLIYLMEGENKVNLLDTPYAVLVKHNQAEEMLMNFSNSKITFTEDNTYLLGFEMINRNDKTEKIYFRVGNSKGNYSLLKGSPTSDWSKLTVGDEGFSLDYELYFTGCD